MNIRLAQAPDTPQLAELFRQTVLVHGPQYYTPEQTEVWASFASDTAQFTACIDGVTTLIAENDTGILGFVGIGTDGHVALSYVRHDCLRQGVGSALMQRALTYARNEQIPRLYTEASVFSLGLFQKFGFRLEGTEIVDRQGVTFERYRLALELCKETSPCRHHIETR